MGVIKLPHGMKLKGQLRSILAIPVPLKETPKKTPHELGPASGALPTCRIPAEGPSFAAQGCSS